MMDPSEFDKSQIKHKHTRLVKRLETLPNGSVFPENRELGISRGWRARPYIGMPIGTTRPFPENFRKHGNGRVVTIVGMQVAPDKVKHHISM